MCFFFATKSIQAKPKEKVYSRQTQSIMLQISLSISSLISAFVAYQITCILQYPMIQFLDSEGLYQIAPICSLS